MKVKDFDETIKLTPKVVPIYEVIKVPKWASKIVKKGDFAWFANDTISVRTKCHFTNLHLGASYLDFIKYVNLGKDGIPVGL